MREQISDSFGISGWLLVNYWFKIVSNGKLMLRNSFQYFWHLGNSQMSTKWWTLAPLFIAEIPKKYNKIQNQLPEILFDTSEHLICWKHGTCTYRRHQRTNTGDISPAKPAWRTSTSEINNAKPSWRRTSPPKLDSDDPYFHRGCVCVFVHELLRVDVERRSPTQHMTY